MPGSDVRNLRITLYGTQGSGSIFPARDERLAIQHLSDAALLKEVFEDLAKRADASGRITTTIDEVLGGPIGPKTLAAYAERHQTYEPRIYGGWTTCVHVETADGDDIVLDCGSGFRNCARDLQAKWGSRAERDLHLFGSHSHLDHTEGFDQAAVCFDPRNRLHIYGNPQFLRALDFNLGIFSREVSPDVQGVQTPIFFGVMPATFHACVLRNAKTPDIYDGILRNSDWHSLDTPLRVGKTTITPFEVFHPAPCLGYRIEREGRVFVFCTDHELRHGDPHHPDYDRSRAAERIVIEQSMGADLLYRDGQYLRAEYDGVMGIGESGPVPRVGWGHSCIEDVIDMAAACGVHHTLIGHHDPNRGWTERNWLDESMGRRAAASNVKVEFARAETVFDI
jgi:phosphoribosyl 1,2-cyclic phosphodiesterase